jgi:hypothetical protein
MSSKNAVIVSRSRDQLQQQPTPDPIGRGAATGAAAPPCAAGHFDACARSDDALTTT